MARSYSVTPSVTDDAVGHVFSAEANGCMHAATILYTIRRDDKVLGFAFCYPMHPRKLVALIVELMEWCKDTSPRDKFEGAMAFYRQLKQTVPLIGFSRERDEKFFSRMYDRGVIRLAGVSHAVFPREEAVVWEAV